MMIWHEPTPAHNSLNVERPCSLLLVLYYYYYFAREWGSAEWYDNEGIFIVHSFQEAGFIESKVKVKWSFPPHNPNRVLTCVDFGGPTGFYSTCFYLFILWSSILVMFLIWSPIFYNFIFVLIFLNLLIFWSRHYLTYKKKKKKVISN